MKPDIESQAVHFNNAGVACFCSDPKKAWELFKGALEVKLAIEQTMTSQLPANLPLYYEDLLSNPHVQRAQTILEEGDEGQGENASSEHDNMLMEVTLEEGEAPRTQASSTTLYKCFSELGDIFYTPFLFSEPFLIPDLEAISPSEHQASSTSSASIIFNLALVEHLFNQTSHQALSLYELATSLLAGKNINGLSMALINNIGVWCYENDDIDAAQRCMDYLSRIMRNPCYLEMINTDDQASIRRNICCMLTPRCTTSPAA